MPFVTEKIWQHLPHEGESITVAAWPTVREDLQDTEGAAEMHLLVDIIRSVRNIRAEVNTPMSKKFKCKLKQKMRLYLLNLRKTALTLSVSVTRELTIQTDLQAPEKAMTAIVSGAELFLPLADLINLDEERARLEKELEKFDKEVERVQKKLSNQGFVAKAPAAVIEGERAKEQDYLEKREAVRQRLADLEK